MSLRSLTSRSTSKFSIVLLLSASLFALTGCKNINWRGQSPDELLGKKGDEKQNYVGKICRVWGLNYAKVEGIGLAVNLMNTGSNPVKSGQKDHMKRELEAREIEGIPELIAADDTSMVLLRGYLPPGIRKGDPFDIEVGVMPNTETTSLERGFVLKTSLRPIAKMGRSVKQGVLSGFAEGQVIVNSLFETTDNSESKRRSGWIYGGGVALESRPLGLSIVSEDSSVQLATAIATAINKRYTVVDKGGRRGAAVPKTDRRIELTVPDEYRLNISRFLQGVLNVVHSETAKQRANRLDQLDRELADPEQAQAAAIRLEALGTNGIPALKRALRHTDDRVRFFAAQALAYLGENDGVRDLEHAAANDPVFRWQALTALSSIEHSVARESLERLLHSKGAEIRYGAFCALRARDEDDLLVRGERLANSFYFHRIESETDQPLIHISRSRRPEIVMYGEGHQFNDGFTYVQPKLTIKKVSPVKIKISSYHPANVGSVVCDNDAEEVIRALSKFGYGYGTMIRLFRHAASSDGLQSRVAINAVPNAKSTANRKLEETLTAKKNDSDDDMDLIPELFREPEDTRENPRRMDFDSVADKKKKSSPVDKLKGIFNANSSED